ncbi:hypothetical protein [Alicyclobacillus sp. SO9]|uniref:type IV pilus modification PilV family protein n=1 Tax=Alicyclobacillus sp. SO9 TaxID=2665646 RepID=UPI0018E866C0|nr:hypothetical protein [Alicyclobacillus sp. SO9]QQE76992.1 hypothetical protein GI364_13455 [Alicyclobacillus sp. SO9]
MSLMEVTVSILIMAVGVTACGSAWTSCMNEIEFASELNEANLCADNTAEALIAGDTSIVPKVPGKNEGERRLNDSSCKVQVISDFSAHGGVWEEIVTRTGKAVVTKWVLSAV